MEGAAGAVPGLCAHGGWVGRERGEYMIPEPTRTKTSWLRAYLSTGRLSLEVYRSGLFVPNTIFWSG